MIEIKLTGKIGVAELACLLFISNIARLYLSYPRALIEGGAMAGWIVAIIATLFSLLYLWLFITLMKNFPGQSLVEVHEKLLGRFLGTLVNLFYAVFLLALVVAFFREYSEAMISSAMPRTPLSIIVGVFALAAVGTAFFSLDTLARTARLTTPFIVAALVLSLVTVLNFMDWHNYFPILGTGPLTLLTEGFKYSLISEGVLAAVLFPYFQDWIHFRKATFFGVLGGGVAMIALVFVYQGVFITNEAIEQSLPYYRLVKVISLGRFFQRIESIFLLSWGMVGMIKLAVTLYAGALVLTKTFRLPDNRPILWLSLIVTVSLSFLPKDLPTAIEFDTFMRIWGLVPAAAVPALLIILSNFRKRKGAAP